MKNLKKITANVLLIAIIIGVIVKVVVLPVIKAYLDWGILGSVLMFFAIAISAMIGAFVFWFIFKNS